MSLGAQAKTSLAGNQSYVPILHCDLQSCGKDEIIQGVTLTPLEATVRTDFGVPGDWVSVSIESKLGTQIFDACCNSHAAKLFARNLMLVTTGSNHGVR